MKNVYKNTSQHGWVDAIRSVIALYYNVKQRSNPLGSGNFLLDSSEGVINRVFHELVAG